MKIVAFVPLKMNSQRIPHKNILPIGRHPLCWYICNSLLKIEEIDETYVYCSDMTICQYIPSNILFIKRPIWLDEDEVKGFDIYKEFIGQVNADIYILAHATSPFISADSIKNALMQVVTQGYDSAFSAQKIQTFAWYKEQPINYVLNNVPRTQEIEPVWIETSGFYIFTKEIFTKYKRRIGFHPYIQEVEGIEAIDIDERKDYDLACRLYETEGEKR